MERPIVIFNEENDPRLFVTGLPRKMPLSEVKAYFSQFGPVEVEGYDSFFKKYNHISPVARLYIGGSGYCIIHATNQAVKKEILAHYKHCLGGRSLGVTKYMEGEELVLFNSDRNSRRVILKKVPATISDNDLKQLIEIKFGQIEDLYVFKSFDCRSTKKTTTKKIRSISLIFKNKADSDNICDLGKIDLLDGSSFTVEKFKRSRIDETEILPKFRKANKKSERKDNAKDQCQSYTLQENRCVQRSLSSNMDAFQYPTEQLKSERSETFDENYYLQEDKPNNKKYFFSRQRVPYYNNLTALSSRLRWNLLAPGHSDTPSKNRLNNLRKTS